MKEIFQEMKKDVKIKKINNKKLCSKENHGAFILKTNKQINKEVYISL